MVISDAKQKEMILQAANAELDPETYEGGSIEAGAKFMDSKLREMDLVSEDFDIKERVKQTAIENGVKEEEAELAGSLTENFARVMTNLTNETPREQWENGGSLLVEDARKPNIDELEPVSESVEEGVMDENGITHYSDGTYDDGEHIYKADGTILFQSAKDDTNSQSFKKWFRDSKVVDKNENPLVVYHGTNQKFNVFKGTKISNSSEGVGFNFAASREIAEGFGEVMPVYLRIENPVYAYSTLDLIGDNYEDNFEDENREAINKAIRDVVQKLEKKGYTFYEEVNSEFLPVFEKSSQAQEILDGLLDLGGYIKEDYDNEELYNDIRQAEIEAFGIDGYITNKYGSSGVKVFVAFLPNQIKSVKNNGDFDIKNKDIYKQGENNPRGYIELTELGNVIHLLKTADASTIVHELGHYFVNRYLSALEKAGKLEEAKGVLDWLGVSSVKELTREHHEKFARGFETYVMEGEAPNTQMQGLFTRFKNFLIGVYKDLTSGKILKPEEINDDVRSFFDKMLAVDETPEIDIEKIRAKSGALKEIVQNAIKGKEVSVDGLTLEDVNDLLKAVNARLPRKPKNLTQLLRQAGGINLEFARMMDIDKAMGLQDAIGGAQGLFVKNGGIDKEDSLVEFLRQNGFIYGDNQTYEDTSQMWDDAMTAIENADNLYTQEGQEIMDRRDSLLEAAEIAQNALGDFDYDSLIKAVKELRKNNIAAVNKDTLKYINAKLKSIDSDYKKLMGNMLKSQKADFQKMQSDLIDFIKGQPLTGDSKVKLLSAIKKAKSMDVFYRVLNEVNERAKSITRTSAASLFKNRYKKN